MTSPKRVNPPYTDRARWATPQPITMTWRTQAACTTNPDLFFPPDGEYENETCTRENTDQRERRERAAKRICAECPVWADCRDEIMASEGGLSYQGRYGVWGGLSERDRANLAAAQRINRLAS